MTKFRKSLLMGVCLTLIATALTSCLDDDNEDNTMTLTTEQVYLVQTAISGQYSGKMYFYDHPDDVYIYANSLDSIDATWTLDASMNLSVEFPVSVLKYYDTFVDDSLTLRECGYEMISATCTVPNTTYTEWWNQQYYTGYFTFPDNTTFTAEDGKSVILTHPQYMTAVNSYGNEVQVSPVWQYYNNAMSFYLLINQISVDGSEHSVNGVFSFVGTKF